MEEVPDVLPADCCAEEALSERLAANGGPVSSVFETPLEGGQRAVPAQSFVERLRTSPVEAFDLHDQTEARWSLILRNHESL